MDNNRVSCGEIVSYGLLYAPLALFAITYYVYIPKFYSDFVGLELVALSGIFFFTRAFDAVIDPLLGRFSDRTRTRFGRRKPWIVSGLLPLAGSFYLLARPDLRPSFVSLPAYFTTVSFLFFLFWTVVSIPYEALGAELSFEYDERTKVLSFRDGFGILGTLLAGVVPYVCGLDLSSFSSEGADTLFAQIVLCYGIALFILGLLCVYGTNERIQLEDSPEQATPIFSNIKQILANKPFRILLLAYTISALGAGLPATLMPYFVEYRLGSSNFSIFLTLYFLIGFLCLPLWVYFSKKVGKRNAWLVAMFVNTAAFFAVAFVGSGQEVLYGILVSISAVGYGASLALPSSMQADVIDLDELEHGSRREGQFIGLWSIAKKLAAASGAALALYLLSLSGYQANVQQSENTLKALSFLYAGIPCICNFIAIVLAFRYSLSREAHQEVRSKIDSSRETA